MYNRLSSKLFQSSQFLTGWLKNQYECPLCGYTGFFIDIKLKTGYRKDAMCPSCGSVERHRLQRLVCDLIFENFDPSNASILHFAPEPFFENYFKGKFKKYTSADLFMERVDIKCDLTNLPFDDGTFDFIFASHVLEHIQDDAKALAEIRRVLKSNNSIAIIPVPIVCEQTIEYSEPNPLESGHIRAPGKDYYQKYAQYFSMIKILTSSDFSEKYQPFVYELGNPLGDKREDYVPICYL